MGFDYRNKHFLLAPSVWNITLMEQKSPQQYLSPVELLIQLFKPLLMPLYSSCRQTIRYRKSAGAIDQDQYRLFR